MGMLSVPPPRFQARSSAALASLVFCALCILASSSTARRLLDDDWPQPMRIPQPSSKDVPLARTYENCMIVSPILGWQ
eukprot:8208184-Pyramimonas_sp.AAC.1